MKSWIKAWINDFASNAEAWYILIIALVSMFVSFVIIAIAVICVKKYKSNKSKAGSHNDG